MSAPTPRINWFPKQSELSNKSILLSAGGALLAVALVSVVSRHFLSSLALPIIAASMGASAVLLFVVPHSSLSRPWPFVGGHLISALIGIGCAQWIPDTSLAAALAVSGAILAMHYLQCMHPPGGAAALLAVVGGDAIHDMGLQFLFTPVLLNVVIMLGCAIAFWKFTDVHQPIHAQDPGNLDHNWQRSERDWLITSLPFSKRDLAQAITDMDTFIDISHEDLSRIYAHAQHYAYRHQLDGVLCRDAMSQPAIYVHYDTELDEAWSLFKQHNIRGLPVADSFRRVIGIVTVNDFVTNAKQLQSQAASDSSLDKHSIRSRLAELRQRTPGFEANKPEVAGQIMSSPVITAQENDLIAELMPLFTQHAIHHIPVVDDKRKLVGMLTREDVMAAWAASSRQRPAQS